jgi:hypothetical protein
MINTVERGKEDGIVALNNRTWAYPSLQRGSDDRKALAA